MAGGVIWQNDVFVQMRFSFVNYIICNRKSSNNLRMHGKGLGAGKQILCAEIVRDYIKG